jgi:hypothetical protein
MSDGNCKTGRDLTENDKIVELKAFRKVGEEFTYLGRLCKVIKHYEVDFNYNADTSTHVAKLQCRYVTNHGVLKEIDFDHFELGVLKDENPKA